MGKPVKFSDKGKRWNYQRRVRTRSFRQRILIVCEGEKTERYYFEIIRKFLPPNVVKVEVEGQGMNTLSLVNDAISLRDKQSGSSHPFDQTWAVFDKNSFPAANFDNAIEKCRQQGLRAAWSNQAFELWYVLHFEDRQTGMHREQYKECLSGHLSETYFKNDPNMYGKLKAKGNEALAIRRARQLHQNISGPPSTQNPCTTVYELVEELNKYRNV